MIRQKNLAGNEKASSQDTTMKRKNRDPDSSVPYLSLSWAEVEPVPPLELLPLEQFNFKAKPVPDEVVTQVLARLEQLRRLYGDVLTGKEDKRKVFIAAVLEAVCLLVGDVTILVEEEVKWINVHVHGQFQYVLKRGTKRISIVEAKRDDIEQGMAQNVTGLEALADAEGIDQTLGTVTSFLSWVIFN